MNKGLLPIKIIFYAIVFLIILAIAIYILGSIYITANNFTLDLPENVMPNTPAERSIISIDNVKVKFNNANILEPGKMLKSAFSDAPLFVSFDIIVPSSSDYRNGLDVEIVFKGYGNENDFDDCKMTVTKLMPGETRTVSTDKTTALTTNNCPGGAIMLKKLWSGPTTIKMTASKINGDAIATTYAPFQAYSSRSSLEGGDICEIMKNIENYPRDGVYLWNDGGEIKLGSKKIEAYDAQGYVLTINGNECNNRFLDIYAILGSTWRNTITTPIIPENGEISIPSYGFMSIFKNGDSEDCTTVIPGGCESINLVTGGKSIYIDASSQ